MKEQLCDPSNHEASNLHYWTALAVAILDALVEKSRLRVNTLFTLAKVLIGAIVDKIVRVFKRDPPQSN